MNVERSLITAGPAVVVDRNDWIEAYSSIVGAVHVATSDDKAAVHIKRHV